MCGICGVEKSKGGFALPLDSWLGQDGQEEVRFQFKYRKNGFHDVVRAEYFDPLLSGFVDQTWNASK